MRILMLAFNYAPERTGGGVTTSGRASYLASVGHEVTVISGFPYYPEWRTHLGYRHRFTMSERIDGVSVLRRWHHVPRRAGPFGRAAMEATFAATAIPTAFRSGRPDLILSATPAIGAALAGSIAARRHHIPHGILVLDLAGRSAQQSGMPLGTFVRRIAEPLESRLLRSASRVGIVAEGFRSPLEGMGVDGDRIKLLTDWKVTSEPSIPRIDVRGRLGLPLEAPIVLHAGNMGFKQGLENVPQAAALAAKLRPDVQFVLVGAGSERSRIEDAADELELRNLHLLPLQPVEWLPSILGAADVLLLNQRASVTDMSLPSKLADYFASGTPVIAAVNSQSEAAREVHRAGAGIAVEPEDPAALVDAILDLLSDPARARALGEAGQSYARSRYTREALGSALDEFVERLRSDSL